MWKLSKRTLFLLMLSMAIIGGLLLSATDWRIIKSGNGWFNELQLPIIFLGLSLFFMIGYVNELNEKK